MLRHYFQPGYANRAAGLLEAFSLLHGQKHFKLDFQEMPMGSAMPMAYTDIDSIDPFTVSNAAKLISCGLNPAPSFAFLFKDQIILKEPSSFLSHLLAESQSVVLLTTRVYDYPQTLLVHISNLIKTADPGPLSHTELFRQQKKVKEDNKILYSDELETYLEKQKYLITGRLEEKGIKTTWA